MISVVTTKLSHFSIKAAIDNTKMNEHGCVPGRLSLEKLVVNQIWPTDHILPTSAIETYIRNKKELKS